MLPRNSLEKKVYESYMEYADKIWENGYRFNPVYIALKALSDWLLLTSVDIKDKKILNIGCAEPIDELQFVEKVEKWVALDINEKLIRTAEEIAKRKLHPDLFKKLEFVQGDATEMQFEDNTFDIVVSFSAIEHIPDKTLRQKALKEMARVVKKEGYVIVTVPNKFSTFYFAHKRNMKLKISDYGYAYLYTPFEIKKALKTAGLTPVKFISEYSALRTFPSFLPTIISRILYFPQYFGERMGYLSIKMN